MSDPQPISIEYQPPEDAQPTPLIPLGQIFGTFPRVVAAPSWVPRSFESSFAFYVSGTTYRLYVYDFAGKAWRYATLS